MIKHALAAAATSLLTICTSITGQAAGKVLPTTSSDTGVSASCIFILSGIVDSPSSVVRKGKGIELSARGDRNTGNGQITQFTSLFYFERARVALTSRKAMIDGVWAKRIDPGYEPIRIFFGFPDQKQVKNLIVRRLPGDVELILSSSTPDDLFEGQTVGATATRFSNLATNCKL